MSTNLQHSLPVWQGRRGKERGEHAYLVSSLEIPAAAALAKGLSSFNRNETETKKHFLTNVLILCLAVFFSPGSFGQHSRHATLHTHTHTPSQVSPSRAWAATNAIHFASSMRRP